MNKRPTPKRKTFSPNLKTLIVALCLAQPALVQAQWTSVGNPQGVSAGGAGYIQLVSNRQAGTLYLAYHDSTAGKGSVQQYDGNTWSYLGGNTGVSAGSTMYTSIAAGPVGDLFYSYQDNTTSLKMTALHYNAGTWTDTWQNISTGSSYFNSIKVANNGYPCMVYRDLALSGGKLTAKKFDGSTWLDLGTPGFSLAASYYPSMAISSDDTVFVSSTSPLSVTQVHKIHASASSTTAWQMAGTTGYSTLTSQSIFQCNSAMAIDSLNRTYLIYVSTTAQGSKLNAKKYENGQWTSLGADNFSPGAATWVSIAVTPTGTPYVAFTDAANGTKTTIMKYDGTQWAIVGSAGISTGISKYNTLAIDAANQPVVAFADAGKGNKTVVMRFVTQPLPLSASSLIANKLATGKTQLQWTSYDTDNKSNYLLQRSSDAKDWDKIATIAAKQANGSNVAYSYTDDAQPATSYYRLVQKATDGSVYYSNTVIVSPNAAAIAAIAQVDVVPNPATDHITIKAHNTVNATIVITDPAGKTVLQENIYSDEQVIDISSLPQGIYILHYTSGNTKAVKKLVKL